MALDLCELSPSWVRSIAPYQPGKPTSELAREMGLDGRRAERRAHEQAPRGQGGGERDPRRRRNGGGARACRPRVAAPAPVCGRSLLSLTAACPIELQHTEFFFLSALVLARCIAFINTPGIFFPQGLHRCTHP